MVADREYIERVRDYGWEDVAGLWNDVLQCSTPGWDAGKALEYLVLKGFELSGAKVRWPFTVTHDDKKIIEQVDGMIYSGGISAIVECKDYSKPSTRSKRPVCKGPIATLLAHLMRRPSPLIGCLFVSGNYTESAQVMVNSIKPATILCWTGDDIDFCLNQRDFALGLRRKYRACMEEGKHCMSCAA